MRKIEIEWVELDLRVTAEMVEDLNPSLRDLLWRCLPYESIQTHALVSGEHLYHVAPIVELVTTAATTKIDRTRAPDGTIFLSQLQHLAIKYGRLSEYIPAAPIAHVVPADLPVLRRAGEACWDSVFRTKRAITVRVRRKGDANTTPYFPGFGRIESPSGQELLEEVVAETRRTWLEAPAELVDLHAGRIRSGAGSAGQWLSTLVFVNGETRPLGYGAFGGLMQACKKPEVSLEILRALTPHFVKVPSEFLGYCGLGRLWNFVERALAILPDLRSKEEYFSLMSALGLYTNQLNAWNLHYFPWHLGGEAFAYADGRAAVA